MSAAFDHLVIGADSLDAGVAWCETALRRTPSPGGAHALFGTHNRLLPLGSPPRSYLELIAVNPAVRPTRAAPLKRWFDLDHPAMGERLRTQGPQAIHWVARVPDIDAARQAWLALGIDPGPVLTASRETPRGLLQWRITVRSVSLGWGPAHWIRLGSTPSNSRAPSSRETPRGLLQWRITVRDDGARLFDGVLPSLIQWAGPHPSDTLPASGLVLQSLRLAHPQAPTLNAALRAIGLDAFDVQAGDAAIGWHVAALGEAAAESPRS